MHHGKLRALATGVFFVIVAAPRIYAQMSDLTCTPVYLFIREASGNPIQGADVTMDESTIVTSGFDGSAIVDCRVLLMRNEVIEVRAVGFKPERHLINSFQTSSNGAPIDIYLTRADGYRRPTSSATVGVGEMSHGVQEASEKLQAKAVDALNRADYPEAEQLLRQALELTPSDAAIYNNIGISYIRRREHQQAVSWFEKAIKLEPYNPLVAGNLGLVRYMDNRREESYTLLTRAMERGYESPMAEYVMGLMELEKGHAAIAAEHLAKVKTDRFPLRDLYLSIAQQGSGKQKEGVKTFQTFLKGNPAPLIASRY